MKNLLKLKSILIVFLSFFAWKANAQLFPNGDFELGTPGVTCNCATNFTCGNDAGRVIDGVHPLFTVGTSGGCIGPTNYSPQLGANSGTCTMYFYAGADNFDAQPVNFAVATDVDLSIFYCGPQGWGASGQNTANSHFSFKVNGAQVGPDVPVPTNTGWTQHTFTVTVPAGTHTFGVLSGGAAQYSIWFDDFNAVPATTGCDAAWTTTTACSTDPPINLDPFITGDTGGTWSGTGVTGNTFDPSSGSQSITYTAPGGCDSTQTISVTTTADGSWTLPGVLCSNDAPIDLDLLVTGTAGGTWSGTGVTGNMFDPSSGSSNVTYQVGTVPCDATVAQMITVTPAADASWTPPGAICEADGPIDLNLLITGTGGGTWSGTGVAGFMFDPTGLSGPISITYDVGTAPCTDQLIQDITVVSNPVATWTPPTTLCTSDAPMDLTGTITGTAGGTWSGTGITGSNFDPSLGTQTITYTVGSGSCQQVSTQDIIVATGGNPAWTLLSMCVNDAPLDLTGQITGDLGGTWSGTGITGSTFDPSNGSQSITYSVGAGACATDLAQTIDVYDPQATISSTDILCRGGNDGTATANVTGGSGNYTYLWSTTQTTQGITGLAIGTYTVDVTDVDGGCTVSATVDITEPPSITTTLSATLACAPSLGSATVDATGGVGGFTYLWAPSAETTQTAVALDSSMHTVVVTDANGCTQTDSIEVHVFPSPTATIINDTTITKGDCLRLDAWGGSSYIWTPDLELTCFDCQDPIACPPEETIYCAIVTDSSGCQDSACVKIGIEIICGEVFVPSAFSPNNDNENDFECLYSDCIETFVFTIYNRWGEKVFETSDMSICWDGTWKGKDLNSAVFVYRLEGNLITGEQISQKGNISLIR